jgi:hypothetical protein
VVAALLDLGPGLAVDAGCAAEGAQGVPGHAALDAVTFSVKKNEPFKA